MISVISSFAILAIAALITLILKNNRNKGILAISAICTAAVFTSITAVLALTGQSFQYQFYAGAFLGNVRLCMDGLSAWFSLIISLVFSLGAFYGWGYMQHYLDKKNDIGMHIFAYLMAYLSMQALCVLQHSLAFLLAWEIMALSSFVLIIFESWKADVIKAGINFFIQSHVSVVLLTIGFLMMSAQSGSFDFNSFASLSAKQANTAYVLLFLGFAVKAGLLPFHTWLPHAHPAAPAHISGVMSGVIIKIGIFGMLRMLSFAPIHYEGVGYLVLTLAAISGLYGIMQAIVQKNIKKLLAYSSIENIGIICMGIGLGLIGVGSGQSLLTYLGFAAALLHTLNHALFKSSLFFLAGNVYHATHSLNMEQMGGLGKKMPWTCLFFLLGSVAICALPPMNGFVSEFMLYNGLFRWMQEASLTGAVGASFAILALVLIGGLAIICFTKVFG
ncbi:MAG: NADH-quinone oxidoreductase subunit E, partial [Bacteroidales bacterium]|nr:NADH-quinone oxidoreductase subunit E [Bacteroidales bacterium]